MTTRRERLERRAVRRRDWADKASAKSSAAYEASRRVADAIPLGQPILVGHHSERRHRRDISRMDAAMSKTVEQSNLARHHESKARGLELQLARSIYDDDHDALERLEEKIAECERQCEHGKQGNRLYKRGGVEAVAAEMGADWATAAAKSMAPGYSWVKSPFNLTSLRAEIRRCKERIRLVVARRERGDRAQAAGGVTIEGTDTWAVVTFAEKPSGAVLDALRNASYRWARGSWQGPRSQLPHEVSDLLPRSVQEAPKEEA